MVLHLIIPTIQEMQRKIGDGLEALAEGVDDGGYGGLTRAEWDLWASKMEEFDNLVADIQGLEDLLAEEKSKLALLGSGSAVFKEELEDEIAEIEADLITMKHELLVACKALTLELDGEEVAKPKDDGAPYKDPDDALTPGEKPRTGTLIKLNDSTLQGIAINRVNTWEGNAQDALGQVMHGMSDFGEESVEFTGEDAYNLTKDTLKLIPKFAEFVDAVDQWVSVGKGAYKLYMSKFSSSAPLGKAYDGLADAYTNMGEKSAALKLYNGFVKQWKFENNIPSDFDEVYKEDFQPDLEAFLDGTLGSSHKLLKTKVRRELVAALVKASEDDDHPMSGDSDQDGSDAGYIDLKYELTLGWKESDYEKLKELSGDSLVEGLIEKATYSLRSHQADLNDVNDTIKKAFKKEYAGKSVIDTPLAIRAKFVVTSTDNRAIMDICGPTWKRTRGDILWKSAVFKRGETEGSKNFKLQRGRSGFTRMLKSYVYKKNVSDL